MKIGNWIIGDKKNERLKERQKEIQKERNGHSMLNKCVSGYALN